MSFSFSAFGLSLSANLMIPGLVRSEVATQADVQVWFDTIPVWLDQLLEAPQQNWYSSPYKGIDGKPGLKTWLLAGDEYFRLLYGDGTQFIVSRLGTQIWATWPDNLTLEDTATYLLGPVLGFVLRLRGVICLHASAVAVGKQAIALLGTAGSGKSTTAAAFAKLGYPVLSDDIVALSDRKNCFWVQPAYPRIRLWSESVNALYDSPDALPRIVPTHPTWDKRYLDLTQNGYHFQQQPLPLAAIYILENRSHEQPAPRIELVPAPSGFMELIANTYTNYLLDKAMRAKEFEGLKRLLTSVSLWRLTPHADLTYLPQLCKAIVENFEQTYI